MKAFFLDQHTVRGDHIVIVLVRFRVKLPIVDPVIPFILKLLNVNGGDARAVADNPIQDIKYIAVDDMVEGISFLRVKRYKA